MCSTSRPGMMGRHGSAWLTVWLTCASVLTTGVQTRADEPAQIVTLGELHTVTINTAIPQIVLECQPLRAGLVQAVVVCPQESGIAPLTWSLETRAASESKFKLLDGGAAGAHLSSRWIAVPTDTHVLRLRLSLFAPAELTCQVGFDFQSASAGTLAAMASEPVITDSRTPTRFRDSNLNNMSSIRAVLLPLDAKLERDTLFNFDIAGQWIYFQVYRDGAWQTLPEDGITTTTQWTDDNGIGRNYYVLPQTLTTGNYPLRAVYDGNSEYEPASRQVTLTVNTSNSYLQERHPHTVGSGRVPLILVHGNGGESSTDCHWTHLLDYIDAHASDFAAVDVYVWKHDTSRAVGFDGATGNALELANAVYSSILPNYPPGTKVVLVAHSRGGLVCRAFMNYAGQGDDVARLITLGTPHHGSPFAVPDWAAMVWALRVGNSMASRDAFNMLIGKDGMGFDIDRLGSLHLAWDDMDWVIQGWVTLGFDVNFAAGGTVKTSYRDMNADWQYDDETVMYSYEAKRLFGTLYDLNVREGYFDRIVTFGMYDDNLSDNPGWSNIIDVVVNAMGSLFSDHYGLSAITRLLAYMSDGIAFNSANYVANDGMVPLQSALLLDIGDGVAFADRGSNEAISIHWDRLSSHQQVRSQHVYTGSDARDHLDLLDSSNDAYWSDVTSEIKQAALDAACLTPPEYNYTIYPWDDWQTTAAANVIAGGCRVYRMYLWDDTAYDFSLCSGDAVGGAMSAGDGDLALYDPNGTQVWYIDGDYACNWAASTLHTAYEGWTPPTTGWYYLQVSEFYDHAFTYTLAYKGRIKLGNLTVNIEPAEACDAGAAWSLDGSTWYPSGTTIEGLWIGTYVVQFTSVPGWLAPAVASVQVTDGQTATLAGTFARDCNANMTADADEIAAGAHDCDGDGVLDVCEPDGDGDGVPDGCDACRDTPAGVVTDTDGCPFILRADYDRDGDVDLEDFGHLQACLGEADVLPADAGCVGSSLDADGDVDAGDVLLFESCVSGQGVASACSRVQP